MQDFIVESELGTESIKAADQWQAAGEWAAQHAGFDTDEPCWDPFWFSVNEVEFSAEIKQLGRSGTGVIVVFCGDQKRIFDHNATELDQNEDGEE